MADRHSKPLTWFQRLERIFLELVGYVLIFNQWLVQIFKPARDWRDSRLGWFMYNLTTGSIWAIEHVIKAIEPGLKQTFGSVIDAVEANGESLLTLIEAPLATFTGKAFKAVTEHLEAHGHISPSDWKPLAADAMTDAYGFGLSSAAITAMFEALFPEKLNCFNAVGPMLKSLAGFDEVTAAVLRPMLRTGISVAALYDANAKFTPQLPAAAMALQMWSRRMLSDSDTQYLLRNHGFAEHWDSPQFNFAYRPISPRALATMMQDQPFDRAKMKQILEDNSYSPAHVDFMLDEFEYSSLKNLRNSLVATALHAYERGVMPDQELESILDDQGWSPKAKKYARDHALLLRRITLAQKVELQIVPLVSTGQISAAEGEQQMEAAGIEPWYADLEMTLAETKATLAAAKLEAAAERRNELTRQRNLTRAAIVEYQAGRINVAELAAALVAIGLTAPTIASITAVQEAKLNNAKKLTFGQHLDPLSAEVLKDQVSAIEQQTKDRLITLPAARSQLQHLQIPVPEIDALLSRWAAGFKKSPGAATLVDPLTGNVETNVTA